jgi:uncharacterized protein YidB (DUF937 family)
MNWKTILMGSIITIASAGALTTAFAATNSSTGSSSPSTTAARPNHQGGFHAGRRGPWQGGNFATVSKILGIDTQTLQTDLKSGQSIVAIAQTNGISEQTLITQLQANLKTQLDAAVQAGKLTASQAQNMLSHFPTQVKQFVEHKGPMPMTQGGFARRAGVGVDMRQLPQILGITSSALKSDLQSGKSIADVASSKGISEQTLISKLQADQQTRLDQAVKSGRLTAAQEKQILSNFASHMKQFVEHKGLPAGPGGFRGHPGSGGHGNFNDLSTILGISAATLQSDFKSGQSLLSIAQSKGMTESTLISDLTSSFKTHLDQAVQSGKMTSAQESQRLADFTAHVKQMVEGKLPHRS